MSLNYFRRATDAPGLRTDKPDAPTILRGHAAVFEVWATVGRGKDPDTGEPYEVRELIRPGAFRHAIETGQDCRALVDHESHLILGRVSNGRLRLAEDVVGLAFELVLGKTQLARDTAENVADGTISECSFGYLPRPGGEAVTVRRERGLKIVESVVSDVDLFDVSVVTYPAYRSTDVHIVTRSAAILRLAGRDVKADVRRRMSALLQGSR